MSPEVAKEAYALDAVLYPEPEGYSMRATPLYGLP